jgi:DNA-binding beta-propeller fold protein YncE
VAVSSAGNVDTADYVNDRILELNAGAAAPSELPFEGLNRPSGIAVDKDESVYVADTYNNRVLKLTADG